MPEIDLALLLCGIEETCQVQRNTRIKPMGTPFLSTVRKVKEMEKLARRVREELTTN